MKKTRYSDEQMVRILRETDKDTVAEVAKRHGVSEATIYAWRKKFGSMETDEVKRLKALERENARLRKLLVDRDLEIDVMGDQCKKVVSAQARLEQAWPTNFRFRPKILGHDSPQQGFTGSLLKKHKSGVYETIPIGKAPG